MNDSEMDSIIDGIEESIRVIRKLENLDVKSLKVSVEYLSYMGPVYMRRREYLG